jgi:hypothetical protein
MTQAEIAEIEKAWSVALTPEQLARQLRMADSVEREQLRYLYTAPKPDTSCARDVK